MELIEAIDIVLSANGGKRPVLISEFVEATNVVLDAMRGEITTSEVIKWCVEHEPSSTTNTI